MSSYLSNEIAKVAANAAKSINPSGLPTNVSPIAGFDMAPMRSTFGTTSTSAKPSAEFRTMAFADDLAKKRDADLAKGKALAGEYFGEGNPAIQELLDLRKARAQGFDPKERLALTEAGARGINEQMAQGMRQLRTGLANRGVRGGAAAGAAMPIMQQAMAQRGALEQNISLADMARRSAELQAYESLVAGERAGTLGTMFGYAGLGAGDRSSAMQWIQGGEFQDYLNKALADAKAARANLPPGQAPLPIGGGGGGGGNPFGATEEVRGRSPEEWVKAAGLGLPNKQEEWLAKIFGMKDATPFGKASGNTPSEAISHALGIG